jgi:hypothetical protein
MRRPVLVVTAYFVDAVEARLNQDFELCRKKNGVRLTREELLSAADGADAMFVTPVDRLDATFFNRLLLPSRSLPPTPLALTTLTSRLPRRARS